MAPYNPPIAHYCHVSVKHIDIDDILRAIGKDGFFFKNITHKCGANYIWWNKENQVIEIWGPYSCMVRTFDAVTKHIEKICNTKHDFKN